MAESPKTNPEINTEDFVLIGTDSYDIESKDYGWFHDLSTDIQLTYSIHKPLREIVLGIIQKKLENIEHTPDQPLSLDNIVGFKGYTSGFPLDPSIQDMRGMVYFQDGDKKHKISVSFSIC